MIGEGVRGQSHCAADLRRRFPAFGNQHPYVGARTASEHPADRGSPGTRSVCGRGGRTVRRRQRPRRALAIVGPGHRSRRVPCGVRRYHRSPDPGATKGTGATQRSRRAARSGPGQRRFRDLARSARAQAALGRRHAGILVLHLRAEPAFPGSEVRAYPARCARSRRVDAGFPRRRWRRAGAQRRRGLRLLVAGDAGLRSGAARARSRKSVPTAIRADGRESGNRAARRAGFSRRAVDAGLPGAAGVAHQQQSCRKRRCACRGGGAPPKSSKPWR